MVEPAARLRPGGRQSTNMTGVLTAAAALFLACIDGPPAAVGTPPRIVQRAAAPARESVPPRAAAPSSRPTRIGSTGHRLHRDAGAPPVRFHVEPEMAGAALGRESSLPPPLRVALAGTSRAPPSIALSD